MTIVRAWPGTKIGFTFAQHKAAGYQGGDDYEVGPGHYVKALCEGEARLSNDGLNGVDVVMDNGIIISQRENKSTIGKFPRRVQIGDQLAVTGRKDGNEVKWPHVDATVHGQRVSYLPLITKTSVIASVGKVIAALIPTSTKDDTMLGYRTNEKPAGQSKKITKYYTVAGYTLESVSAEKVGPLGTALGWKSVTEVDIATMRAQLALHSN